MMRLSVILFFLCGSLTIRAQTDDLDNSLVDSLDIEIQGSRVNCQRQKSREKNFYRECGFFICDPITLDQEESAPVILRHEEANTYEVELIGKKKLTFLPVNYKIYDKNGNVIATPPKVFNDLRLMKMNLSVFSDETQDYMHIARSKYPSKRLRNSHLNFCDSKELEKLNTIRNQHMETVRTKRVEASLAIVARTANYLGQGPITEIVASNCNNKSDENISTLKKQLDEVDDLSEGRILTEKEAQQIFADIKNMQDLDFTMKDSVSGCEARAHIIADRLNKKGIHVGKAWFYGDGQFPEKRRKDFPDSAWSFHVAPYVIVKKEDGRHVRYVLDPASADRPLSVSDFEKEIRPEKAGKPFVLPASPLPLNYMDWPRIMVTFSDKDEYVLHKPWLTTSFSRQQKLDYAWKSLAELPFLK